MIVHLNGWPGVGKQTIGRILAQKLRARFIHNHLLHDVGIVCAGINDPDRWIVYETVRRAAYEALAQRQPSETFVMTNALCKNAPRERKAWANVVELAVKRNVPLIPIVLEAEPNELFRRVQSPERAEKKMTDPALLQEFFAIDELQRPAVSELLDLDVTYLSADDAAAKIQHHVAAIRAQLRPATEQHLELR
jgi:gluconate kinase